MKTACKHTPGPWHQPDTDEGTRVSVYSICAASRGYGHNAVIAVAMNRPPCAGELSPIDHDEAIANARLLTAAPDLLLALKACAAVCAGETLSKSSITMALELARFAIVKATGERS